MEGIVGVGQESRLSQTQNFCLGMFAGMASRSLTAPLETLKVLRQIGAPETDKGIGKSFQHVYRNEGLRAFWKGNAAACIRLPPYALINIFAMSYLRQRMADVNSKMSVLRSIGAGTIATCGASLALYPLDTVKTRLTGQYLNNQKYTSVVGTFRTLVQEEGFMSLYRGASAIIPGAFVFSSTTFLAFAAFFGTRKKASYTQGRWNTFINGSLAVCFAQCCAHPFDTIRKKMQMQSRAQPSLIDPRIIIPDVAVSRSWFDCAKQIVRQQGYQGLWKGNVLAMARVLPTSLLMFVHFELGKRVLLYSEGRIESIWDESTCEQTHESYTSIATRTTPPEQTQSKDSRHS
eukprot:GILK01010437.1.p1 GENE.GILK01010437.1~~GILK01010437.1.p1  ORF type:complete len:347 (-),score=39.59 GILK01010437.1:73-1113(-)